MPPVGLPKVEIAMEEEGVDGRRSNSPDPRGASLGIEVRHQLPVGGFCLGGRNNHKFGSTHISTRIHARRSSRFQWCRKCGGRVFQRGQAHSVMWRHFASKKSKCCTGTFVMHMKSNAHEENYSDSNIIIFIIQAKFYKWG